MASSTVGIPPGFRFHPTDEELLRYYLKKKVTFQKFDTEVVKEVDLNKIEPWELQEKCRIGWMPQNEWYFFSHKDRKYPTGSRTNRATKTGFWKATGRDKCIRSRQKKIGMRKTLVFYTGRAPHGQKTDWIMHEYRLEEGDDQQGNGTEDGWVVCRVFEKKNVFKVGTHEGGRSGINSSDQRINNTSDTNQPQTFVHSDNQHLPRQQHGHDFQSYIQSNKPDRGLHGPTIQPPQYPLFRSQTLMASQNRSLGYNYSGLPSDTPVMAKPLISNPRNSDSDSDNLHYHASEPGSEVNACEPIQQMIAGRDEGLNEWAMLDPLVTS